MDKLDAFINDLQEEIFDDAKAAYGEKGFDRWRNPRFNGKMENPDGHARIRGECGDTMEIFLKIENNRIKDAAYQTDGCASSMICGSFAAELAIGKDPDQASAITGDTILSEIGSLPESDRHCARLAAEVLQEAVGRYLSGRNKT